MTWALSGPSSGKATIPPGLLPKGNAQDGRPVYGKFDTLVYAEEDEKLAWVGIVSSAKPDPKGLVLEFIGVAGWLQKVPFTGLIKQWTPNVFTVVRAMINNTADKKPGFTFIMPTTKSAFTLGDPEPPPKPKQPKRKKGETAAHWQATAAYKKWQKDNETWNGKYASNKPYEVGYWESPMVGAEIDDLAKETGFDYRENVKWKDKAKLEPEYYFDFADDFRIRRTDIEFVDGVNLAKPLDPKDRTEDFANHVIGLGAGEGRSMIKTTVGDSVDDGRLYQAAYVSYKSIKNVNTLHKLAQADYYILSNKAPMIDSIAVWDVPGFASVKNLRCGWEVLVKSDNVEPRIETYVRITKITRTPGTLVTELDVETVG